MSPAGPSLVLPAGAKSPLSEDLLSQQDLALLAVLDFLCVCASIQPVPALPFKPQEVQRRLLQLLQQVDFSRPLHLSMVGVGVQRFQLLSASGPPTAVCLSLVPVPAEEAPC